jgi:3-hydroxyacyl-CoA dehydrogenase/enoyl-CoA hydratase/3-hydroxybutyryl-CoA epimerase
MSAIRYEKDSDNIVTLTMDMPNQSANTMNTDFREAFGACVARLLEEKDQIAGVVLASAKKTFFAGGDLRELIAVTRDEAENFFAMLAAKITRPLRQLETLGKPVVAAINGTALGGGWELCLACHGRVALNDDKIQLGLPEVTLGLLPGGGGTTRLPRFLGLEKALPLLVEGKKISPAQGKALGLITQLVTAESDLLPTAKAWIRANPAAIQPWDDKAWKMPGGTPSHPKMAQMLAIAPAMLKGKTKGCYPAPEAILSAVVEGAQVDFDTAQRIESRYFTSLVISQVAKNMIGTLWFQLNDLKAGQSRPHGFARSRMSKVGVLGAGMMGAGIAYACAAQGLDVVLKDVAQEAADKGKAYSEQLLAKKVSRGRLSREEKDAVLQRIQAVTDAAPLQGCDLIIEAVFESSPLKASVTRETEGFLNTGGIFASNTSTIPISRLATASSNPDKFIGLHFFSPVDKMQLVEIIRGKQTSDETLARSFDFVLQINKIPIVVNDSRGFFTSRVFGTFVNEGITMVAEGIHPASVENAALFAGMPVGPLAVSDEVSLSLMTHVRDQTRADMTTAGLTYQPHPAETIIDAMVSTWQRKGKATGAGFYDYPAKGKKSLWPELISRYTDMKKTAAIPLQELQDRILFIQAIETVRCLEEGVLTSVKDANIGSIFGFGFAPWTGGAIQYINQYGLRRFMARAQYLSDRYGKRFNPPKLLVEKAEAGAHFSY